VITSSDNTQLKLIRKLAEKKHRVKTGLLVAEGEDLVEAALAGGFDPEVVLWSGEDVEPALLDSVSALGSGSRVIGVFHQQWSAVGDAGVSVYLHGVHDPGNVGTILRSAHALADGPVVLGPDCADPWSPKAVRASMGSVFARPPARAEFSELPGTTIALAGGAGSSLAFRLGRGAGRALPRRRALRAARGGSLFCRPRRAHPAARRRSRLTQRCNGGHGRPLRAD
jgi:RNA methyltransferase, TrmH family